MSHEVELCAGGKLQLRSEIEVDRWQTLAQAYISDFQLTMTTDLAALDMILQQHMIAFRAQEAMNGIRKVMDDEGLDTGEVEEAELSDTARDRHQKTMLAAGKEIRGLEASLGIDKKSRDASGRGGVDEYLVNLRRAAAEYGVHIVQRVKDFEQFVMDLRWRVRLNENGDEEDKRYHDCMDDQIIQWCREQLEALEDKDKQFGKEKGKLWAGKL